MIFISKSPKETKKLAENLAKTLIRKRFKSATILALEGELGSGKTTFARGFSHILGIKEKILSPTFVIIHRHKITNKNIKNKYKNLYHIDAYRLNSEEELKKLEIEEIFLNPQNIVLIEWADRIKKIIPKNSIWVHIDWLDKNKRKIFINLKKFNK